METAKGKIFLWVVCLSRILPLKKEGSEESRDAELNSQWFHENENGILLIQLISIHAISETGTPASDQIQEIK